MERGKNKRITFWCIKGVLNHQSGGHGNSGQIISLFISSWEAMKVGKEMRGDAAAVSPTPNLHGQVGQSLAMAV